MYALYSAALSLTASDRMPCRAPPAPLMPLIPCFLRQPARLPRHARPSTIRLPPGRRGPWSAAGRGCGSPCRTTRPDCAHAAGRSSARPRPGPGRRRGPGAAPRRRRRPSAARLRPRPRRRWRAWPGRRRPRAAAPARRPAATRAPGPGWPRAASSASLAAASLVLVRFSQASASSRGGRRNSSRWQRLRIVAGRRAGCALSSHR